MADFTTIRQWNVQDLERSRNLEKLFFSYVDLYRSILTSYGVEAAPPTNQCFETFLGLSNEKKLYVIQNLAVSSEIISSVSGIVENKLNFSLKTEIKLLKQALKMFGFDVCDDEIFEKIDNGDIVEIFDHTGAQLYRSFNFFKYCSYSLADLLTYDWSYLWERPSFVLEKLTAMAPSLFVPGAKTMPFNIEPYAVREKFSADNRSLIFKMKFASPVKSLVTGETSGFICTGNVKVLKADNLSFL